MTKQNSQLDEDTQNLSQTRPMRPPADKPAPPISSVGQPRQTVRQAPVQTRTMPPPAPRTARDSGLYLPWWSLVLTIMLVALIFGGILLAVYAMGNTIPRTTSEPIIQIVTADPALNQRQVILPPTIQFSSQGLSSQGDSSNMVLDGPTLEAIVFTPTPAPLTVGALVAVTGVDANQLNVRDNAGVNGTSILFRSNEGERFIIVGGPQQADGLTWWQIQNVNNTTSRGWAASQYLQVVIE